MTTVHAAYGLGPVHVEVSTSTPELLTYLDGFYERAVGPGSGWHITAQLDLPTAEMEVNSYGVGYVCHRSNRVLKVRTPNLVALKVGTRKAVREALVEHCERRGYTLLHAAAVHRGGLLIVFAGHAGAGKTTLALRAVREFGFELISNDHLILYRGERGALTVTTLPSPIPVKIESFLQLEHLLPPPYDTLGVDVEAWRHRTPTDLRAASEVNVLYTSASLGQRPVPVLECGPGQPTRTVVVLASFARPAAPVPVADPAGRLAEHIRLDWAFSEVHNQRHLPRPDRSPGRFRADGLALAAALASDAHTVEWHHDGALAPLLEHLGCPAPGMVR